MRIVVMYSGVGKNANYIKENIDEELYFITNNTIQVDGSIICIDVVALEYYLNKLKPDLVVLAGWNKIIPQHLTERFKIINQHPTLLPLGKGLYGKQCLDMSFNEKEYGITYHHVTAELDDGAIIKQFSAPTPETYEQFLIDEKELELRSFIEVINSFRD